jgi:MEDS: MEthanogen/methylotroph, DcmR Sensory domain
MLYRCEEDSMQESVALGVLGLKVPIGTHICTFFSGQSGRDDIVMPFLAEGIRAQDKCICVLESPAPAEFLPMLARQFDVGPPVASGQLQLATPAEAYLRSGRFSTEEMLAYWGEAAAATDEEGFSLIRATGEMPSVLDHPAGRAEFFRYEAKLNEVIPTYPEVILCLYDLERWGAGVLMDALRTHPMVVVDGMVHDNPYYVEPSQYLVGQD